jgi:predicted RNase H-like HicB family nuclease
MKFRLTEEIWKEGNMYVSYCPELDISSCGENVQQAKNNLMETILINIEETKKLGTFEKFIEECGLEQSADGTFWVRKELIGFTPIEVGV